MKINPTVRDIVRLIDKRQGVVLVEEFTDEKYYKGNIENVPEKYLDYEVYKILGSYFDITLRISS